MQTTTESLADRYPEAAAFLQNVPDHIAEHTGEVAMLLTHADMHPQHEVESDYGERYLRYDFEQVITDPEFDSSQLEADATEAALAGKQKLSEVLLGGSKMLNEAHQSLTETGFIFGAQDVETDEQRNAREKLERDTVYEAACELILDAATKHHDQGNELSATGQLESLILLRYMGRAQSRKILRAAVRSGLAGELLEATQTANKLFIETDYRKVSDSMAPAKDLLQYATGQALDYNFKSKYAFDPTRHQTGTELEDLKDVMAVMTSNNGWLKFDQGFEVMRASTVMLALKERVAADAPPEAVGSPEYMYELLEASDASRQLLEACRSRDPRLVIDTANALGLEAWEVTSLFGQKVPVSQEIEIDTTTIEGMYAVKQAYPGPFELLTKHDGNRHPKKPGVHYDPGELLEGLGMLTEAGIDQPEFVELITSFEDYEKFTEACSELSAACRAQHIDTSRLVDLAASANRTSEQVVREVVTGKTTAETAVAHLLSYNEVSDGYSLAYRELKYPLKNFHEIKAPELETLPHVQERLRALEIPDEVAKEMYRSWTTYNAFAKHHYRDERFTLPWEAPGNQLLESLAREQTETILAHLQKLEELVAHGGIDATKSIINTFGIYNFARYDPKDLLAQKERWDSGEAIQSVVVSARADWNSFNRVPVSFEEGVGEGVFYFEANSATETARIAVLAGRHERQNGSEPDIRRFIIRAHANANGLVMGVDRQTIDVSDYLRLAEKARAYNEFNESKVATVRIQQPDGTIKIQELDATIRIEELNDYKRHLGPNFEVMLQACSAAGEPIGADKNIAKTMSKRHDTTVSAYPSTVSAVVIRNDGRPRYVTDHGDGEPVTYEP